MSKRLTLAGAVLALALLAGCTQPGSEASPSPDPTPASTPGVTVHWDVLDEPSVPLANRWYEGYTDTLIPSEDYGLLVPYIGGAAYRESYISNWIFGLADHDGKVVTDPVYLDASYPTYYDWDAMRSRNLPMLLLQTVEEGADGEPVSLYGLAAADGSWYSGQVYGRSITVSSHGVLLFDLEGNVVMVAPNGSEVFRWEAGSIPLPGLVPDSYAWDMYAVYDPYLVWYGENGGLLYADLRTGEVTSQAPADYREPNLENKEGMGWFNGVWYEHSGDTLTIHTDDGQTYTLSCYPEDRVEINGDRVLLYSLREDKWDYRLMNFQGKVLSTREFSFLWQNWGDTPSLLAAYDYNSMELVSQTTVLDRDGQVLLHARGDVYQYGDRLAWADEGYYHLSDLEGRDLLCLPRLDS